MGEKAKSGKDAFGDRIKGYEARETERRAAPGFPLVARVDGRGFSRFTKGMCRPFDRDFADLMVEVAKFLMEQTHASVAMTESDEISIILDPFGGKMPDADTATRGRAHREKSSSPTTQFLFDGRFQKLTSVIAGMATAKFVMGAIMLWPERVERMPPMFDCRVFEVPNREEAVAALAWRERDSVKNSVSMAARAYFPHARLQGKSSAQMQEMLFREHGINFNDYPARFKRGAWLARRTFERELDAGTLAKIPLSLRPIGPVLRSETVVLDLPPIRDVPNRVEVLFDGATPVLSTPSPIF